MRGLLKLTLLEIRIFVREPLGFVAAVGVPLAMFLVLGRSVSPGAGQSATTTQFLATPRSRSSQSSRSTARVASSSACAPRRCGRR